MEDLKNALASIVPALNNENLDKRFPEIAEFLMKNYGIESRGKIYLINEIEFYYYDLLYDDIRSDSKTQTMTYKRTAPLGCWFIHRFGADLTFNSNEREGFGGGVLIRSIEDCINQKAIKGPVNCVEELWDEAVSAFEPVAPNPKIVRVAKRDVELDVPTIRITVGKYDRWQSLWRFTIKGKDVSK